MCCLQAGNAGRLVGWFRASLEAWEPRVPTSEGRRRWLSQLRQRELPLLCFCSIQALWFGWDARPHWWGCFLLSLTIHMLTYCGNTLQTHSEIFFYQLFPSPSQTDIKLSHVTTGVIRRSDSSFNYLNPLHIPPSKSRDTHFNACKYISGTAWDFHWYEPTQERTIAAMTFTE